MAWCRAFLSWNKEENKTHAKFLETLRRKLEIKGIYLTPINYEWDNNDKMKNEIRNSMFSIVFMTKEYASSRKYMNRLKILYDLRTRVCPILYFEPFDDAELNLLGSTTAIYKEYCSRLAFEAFGLTACSHDPSAFRRLEWWHLYNALGHVFDKLNWWPEMDVFIIKSHNASFDETTFIRRFVRKVLRQMKKPFHLDFSDKTLVSLQSHLLQITAKLVENEYHLSYLGIVGPDVAHNMLIAKWLYNRLYAAYPVADYLTLYPKDAEPPSKYLPLEDAKHKLTSWAAHVLYMCAYSIHRQKYSNLREVFDDLTIYQRGASLLVIHGLDTLHQFHELYNMLAFLGVPCKIIFTARNENIFFSNSLKWTRDTPEIDPCEQRFFWLSLNESDIQEVTDKLLKGAESVKFDKSKVDRIHSMYDDDMSEDDTDQSEDNQSDSMSEEANEEQLGEEIEGGINACEYKQTDSTPCVTEDETRNEIEGNVDGRNRIQIEAMSEGEDAEEALKIIKIC